MATLLHLDASPRPGSYSRVLSNAFVDGFLAVINDAIAAVMSILTTQIEIPVISWLYQKLFGEPLTILNLVTLVAAIPVTILCRVIEGQYPSVLFPKAAAEAADGGRAAGSTPPVIQRYLGVFAGMLSFVAGCLNSIVDTSKKEDENAPVIGNVAIGLGLMVAALSFPLIDNDSSAVSTWDWASYGVGVTAALIGLAGSSASSLTPELASVVEAVVATPGLAFVIVAFVEDGQTNALADVSFAASIAGCLPGMINPFKFAPGPANLVVGVVDVVGGLVVMALEIGVAFASTDAAPGATAA